jgi:hypothetical protein
MATNIAETPEQGWRYSGGRPSLAEVHSTLTVPHRSASFWRKLIAFAGPGFLVAVGYMDPGNWATDLAGGSKYNYTLLSVIMLSNLMAILLQSLAIKLGVVTGRDLAQACRDHFSKPASFGLWVLCEIAIAACDLAEVIGSAIALNLLFGIPMTWGVCLTALDVLIILFLQQKGFRLIEALVITLIGTIGVCFGLEILFSKPSFLGIAHGFLVPSTQIITDPGMLYIAIGILGATVMPHNLYLHSAVVQTRNFERTTARSYPLLHHRFHGCTQLGLVCERSHSDRCRRHLLSQRVHRRGRDSRCLQAAHPTAGSHRRKHHVRSGAAGLRPELDPHRDARRADRDGRISQYPPSPLAAALDHARDRHYSSSDCHGPLRCERHRQALDLEPGHIEFAVEFCGLSSSHVHQRQTQDG